MSTELTNSNMTLKEINNSLDEIQKPLKKSGTRMEKIKDMVEKATETLGVYQDRRDIEMEKLNQLVLQRSQLEEKLEANATRDEVDPKLFEAYEHLSSKELYKVKTKLEKKVTSLDVNEQALIELEDAVQKRDDYTAKMDMYAEDKEKLEELVATLKLRSKEKLIFTYNQVRV
jgi:chromosome segregation ATPase